MSLLETVPDRVLGDMGGPDGEPIGREMDPRKVPPIPEPVGLDSGMAMGSAIKNLVQVSDKQIEKNNWLYLLMQVHQQRTAKQQEVEQMAKQTQYCEGCGKAKALSMCSGELLCSTCANISGVLSKDPGVIAKRAIKRDVAEALLVQLIEQKGGEWFTAQAQQYLPEEIKVDLAKGPLDAIAKLVDCTSEDVNDLVDIIQVNEATRRGYEERHRELCEIVGCSDKFAAPGQGLKETIRCIVKTAEDRTAERDTAVSLLRRANVAMPDGEMDCELLPSRIAKLATDFDRLRSSTLPRDLVRALDCPDDQWEMAAVQTAAILEQNNRYTVAIETDLLCQIHRPSATLDSQLLDIILTHPQVPLEHVAAIREAM